MRAHSSAICPLYLKQLRVHPVAPLHFGHPFGYSFSLRAIDHPGTLSLVCMLANIGVPPALVFAFGFGFALSVFGSKLALYLESGVVVLIVVIISPRIPASLHGAQESRCLLLWRHTR